MSTELNGVTKAQMEQAFEAWEKGFRIEPEKYRTADECAALSVSQVSAERADYFFELLNLAQRPQSVEEQIAADLKGPMSEAIFPSAQMVTGSGEKA